MPDISSILKQYWNYDSFRPLQEDIIHSILAGKDTLALLPTGGGKSICFQVPSLAVEGICIVVSPLIALMKDQVEGLKKKGIGALMIYSGMSRKDIVRTLENARQEYFKFLYVSPERLETALFKEYLPALNVNLIAIDEAHCISQWGYDFRPSYLRIVALREELPGIPILALTASATLEVQNDICKQLGFTSTNIFRQSFQRPNLSYSVFEEEAKINKLLQVVKNVQGSAIIYCKSRKRTQDIANLLELNGFIATNYHAGLTQEERNKRQQQWVDNKCRIIVCTNAFGMGIDKPDVRLVIHIDIPDSLENYYQEAGRCGRDEKKAYAVLLYNKKDIDDLCNLHATRFPSFESIRDVYDALVNFLQIPLHSGQDEAFNFRIDTFIKNFKLNAQKTLYAIKALEQDGWLDYSDKNITPPVVVFTISKDLLYEFYKAHPELEEIATTLLRTYDGIFGYPAYISEPVLSGILKLGEKEIKDQLKNLASFGIISYTPQNDEPKIIFRKNRVKASDLKINQVQYNNRKEAFVKRIDHIIAYTHTSRCRSRYIGSYFNDAGVPHCGICDNCLSERKTNYSESKEFTDILQHIKAALDKGKVLPKDLLDQMKAGSKDAIWKVLDFMQAEGVIKVDREGFISYYN